MVDREGLTLRAAAQWLVDNGHVRELDHELLCVLLALFSIDLVSELEAQFVPRDAA